MSKAIQQFNGLNGTIGIPEVEKLAELAKAEGQAQLYNRLTEGLEQARARNIEVFNPGRLALEEVPAFDLPGLDAIPDYISPEEFTGLNKAVSPDEIYQYITNLMINTIKTVGSLPWERSWEKTSFSDGKQALNFESKKGYRGINFFLLNFKVELDKDGQPYLVSRISNNPYFLTFKQIEKYKGNLRKGAKGIRVIYFTQMYGHSEIHENGKLEYYTYDKKKFIAWILKNQSNLKILKRSGWTVERLAESYIPILKYYNVFSGEDVTGIDWGELPQNENANKSENEKIEIAEAIIKSIPNPPTIKFGGNQPVYYVKSDSILIPSIEKFRTPQEYYSTLYHELVHSTGNQKRLARPSMTLGSLSTKLDYAKEELVAEMGAVFLCAESGILFHVIDNSAAYLKGWNSRLVKSMEEDNRFYFRAASAAQAAADYILDRDKNGNPAYLKTLEKRTLKKEGTGVKKETLILGINGDILPDKEFKGTLTDTKETSAFSKNEIVWFKNLMNARNVVKVKITKVHPVERTAAQFGKMNFYYDVSFGNGQILRKRLPTEIMKISQPSEKTKSDIAPPKKKVLAKATESNPVPKNIKPKSISVASAIEDIMGLPKYKGISKIQANILFKYFKDDAGEMKYDEYGISEKYYDVKGFEYGNLKKDTAFHILMGDYDDEGSLSLTPFGEELVLSIKNRLESKRNQKHNYALFDGLAGIPQFKNRKEAKKYFLDWAKTNLRGKKVFHRELKKYVLFNMKGIEHSISRDLTIPKAALITQSEKMLQNSTLIKTETDRYNRPEIKMIYRMAAVAKIEGEQKEVLLTLREGVNGVIYYDHEIDGIKKLPSAQTGLKSPVSKRGKGVNTPKRVNKNIKTNPKIKNKGLKSPDIEQKQPKQPEGGSYSGECPRPIVSGNILKASDVANMDFETMPLDEGWENLFQTAPKNMRIAVWAKPKNGKTAACCNFASYLTKFGPTLYNFADQGINLSTKNLIEMSGLDTKPNAYITTSDTIPALIEDIEATGAHHVFIDMINQYINNGVSSHQFKKEVLQRFPNVGFTFVMEVTKAGDFKGDQSWTHLVDQLVTIDNYIMETKGRYGNGEKISWEEGAQKYNPKRYEEIKDALAEASLEPEVLPVGSEETYNFKVY